jgi:hypothetical protein
MSITEQMTLCLVFAVLWAMETEAKVDKSLLLVAVLSLTVSSSIYQLGGLLNTSASSYSSLSSASSSPSSKNLKYQHQ